MMQLKLENKSTNVHLIGHKKKSEHGIVVKHGVEVEIKLQGLEIFGTNQCIFLEQYLGNRLHCVH